MTEKPSYEELERRVKVLERELALRFGIEDELKENQDRFRMLYERVPMPYQSLDSDGCIVEVNPAWLKNLGYTRGEVIGRPFSEFLRPDSQTRFRENFPRFKAVGEVSGGEFKMVKKDGNPVLVSFSGQIGHSVEQGIYPDYRIH